MGQAHLRQCRSIPKHVLQSGTEREVRRSEKAAQGVLQRFHQGETALPRLLCVFAHPDDETLALGGCLPRMEASRLLTVTDGAPKDGKDARDHGFASLELYREARRAELLTALRAAGLQETFAPRFPMSVADQEVGLHLAELVRAIAWEIEAFAPEALVTHAYEGGHPDHDGCAFAVHAAVRWFAFRSGEQELPIIEAPFYHAGKDLQFETGSFVDQEHGPEVVHVELTMAQQERKRAMLACFGSQQQTLGQFAVDRELFRAAPRHDFARRPHSGQLLYEAFSWGMDGDRFCALARAASEELFGSAVLATAMASGTARA